MPSARLLPLLTLSLALTVAGCGAGFNPAGNNEFAIQAPVDHVTTAAKLQFTVRDFSGHPRPVEWSVSGGDDETGPGSIDSMGLYTPPPYLKVSAARVQVTAALASDTSTRASEGITVTPAISVAPQNIALTPGSQTRLYASIAQVGAGAVQWSAGPSQSGSSNGRFSASHCQTSHDTFTQCSVLYTAPAALAADTGEVSLRATLRTQPTTQATARVLLNSTAATSPLENEAPQTGADVLGTSGGNAHDSANQYCCGGTLGALINIAGQDYVLSNNHVLARTDQAAPGESILQPGLLDTDCGYAPSYTVATLTYAPRLQDPATNVDAAIAQAASGALDPTGAILGFGTASNGVLTNAAPARDSEDITLPGARLPTVVKSGRTTGLTCSSISHIAVDFNVHYNTACDGSGDDFTRLFTNQIAIGGTAFADSGDSGALLADQKTAQPVGLLFAGNSVETFANPIEDVLHSLSAFAADKSPGDAAVSVVGGAHHAVTCLQYPDQAASGTSVPVPAEQMVRAQEVVTRLRSSLLASDLGILEVAAGASSDAPGQPAIVLSIDQSHVPSTLPSTLEGVRTVAVFTTQSALAAGQTATHPLSSDLSTLPRSVVDQAIAVKQRYSSSLRRNPAVFGVGVGKSLDNPLEAAISVFLDRAQGPSPAAMPATLGGIRVQYLTQDVPRAFDWKHSADAGQHRASCSRRGIAPAQPEEFLSR